MVTAIVEIAAVPLVQVQVLDRIQHSSQKLQVGFCLFQHRGLHHRRRVSVSIHWCSRILHANHCSLGGYSYGCATVVFVPAGQLATPCAQLVAAECDIQDSGVYGLL